MNLVPTTVPAGVSLLLVDDHLIFLDGLSLALAPLARDLRVDSAASVQAAEQCLASHDYDLVLLDLKLPAPQPQDLAPHDLLVAVSAVSVNPVDTKVRRSRAPA